LHSAEAFLVSYSENHVLCVTVVGVEEFSCQRMRIMMILIAAAIRRVHLKCDGTRWCTGREVKRKLVNGVG